jgi:hypothetical protein
VFQDAQENEDEEDFMLNRMQQEVSGGQFLEKFLGDRSSKAPPSFNIYSTDMSYDVGDNETQEADEKTEIDERGAHGGLTRKELEVIDTTESKKDITEINDMDVEDIGIGPVGVVAKSQCCAANPQKVNAVAKVQGILSSDDQLDSSKNNFDGRSMKVGDTQCSTAIDGYIMFSLVSIPGCQPSVGFPNKFPHRCSVSTAHACKEQLFRDTNDWEYYVVTKVEEVPKNWKSRRKR